MPSKSESREKLAKNNSKTAAEVMTGRGQKDNRQSGYTYSHDQEKKEEKILPQLVNLDKDTNVYFAIIKHIWSTVCTKVP